MRATPWRQARLELAVAATSPLRQQATKAEPRGMGEIGT